MSSTNTSVIIPCYLVTNELFELTRNTVKSFREGGIEVELILVDDGSPMEEASKWMKENADVYIRNEKNLGFAPTCNNGFKKAKGYFIVCANNDIEVYPGWWEAMSFPFTTVDPKFKNTAFSGLISYMSRKPEGVPIQDWKIRLITSGGLLRGWMQDGGLLMTTRPVMDEIGMYDEQFLRGGFEDIDWFLRARDKFGKKLIMSGMSAYWHKQGATRWNCEITPGYKEESKLIEQSNSIKFAKKWGWNLSNKCPWYEIELRRG
jgi:hypothetical protein